MLKHKRIINNTFLKTVICKLETASSDLRSIKKNPQITANSKRILFKTNNSASFWTSTWMIHENVMVDVFSSFIIAAVWHQIYFREDRTLRSFAPATKQGDPFLYISKVTYIYNTNDSDIHVLSILLIKI